MIKRFACTCGFACCLLAANALSAPIVPTSDDVVLETVPAAPEVRALEPLRRALLEHPDVANSVTLAQGYLEIGRNTADPRFVSYAQATLDPWLRSTPPSVPVLVLSATALQSSHRFDAALELLDKALTLEPQNAQAWLTKATILEVQGKFAPARQACAHLFRTSDQLVAFTCIASVDSRRGRLKESYRTLQRLMETTPPDDPALRGWIYGQLAEMAARDSNIPGAAAHFQTALQATPDDPYLKAAYADLLLDQGRDAEVIRLLRGNEAIDALLLRLAIAGHRTRTDEARSWSEMYDARRLASRTDDNPHLREQARFLLEVKNDARGALDLAQRNWRVQREPADVHIYLAAAYAAHEPERASEVLEWIHVTGFEDNTLDPQWMQVRTAAR